MRLYTAVLLLLLTVLTLAAETPAYPQCAVCAISQKPRRERKRKLTSQLDCQKETSCGYTACLCSTHEALSSCITANCTTREDLTSRYIDDLKCNVSMAPRFAENDPGTIVPFVLATILFLVRIVAKTMGLGGGWGGDDYTLIVSYILSCGGYAVYLRMIHYGFGRNLWNIRPLDNITLCYKLFYAFTLIYKAVMSLAKISMCLFLLRIFQAPIFRTITYIMIAINTGVAIAWILADSFHCIPVKLAWIGWDATGSASIGPGQCIDFIASTFANGFANIAVDVIMVSMPVYEVMKLRLTWRKRVGVVVMFAVGLILTVIGIIRVVVFFRSNAIDNTLYAMAPICYWSVIEFHIAIVCACLPTFRAVVAHFCPGLLGGSSEKASSGRYYYGHTRGGQSQNMRFGEESGLQGKTMAYVVGGSGPKRDQFIPLNDVDYR